MRLGLATAALAVAKPVELTAGTFDSAVEGKNAFVKFFAPWCGHCKAMKPAWDQLGSEYSDHSSVLIGDVDCTVEQGLCSQHGVNGYPTLKYFLRDNPNGAPYQGGRDLRDLKKFVEETLDTITCSLATKEACDADSLQVLEESEKMTAEQRSTMIKAMQKEMADAKKEADALKEKAKSIEKKLALIKAAGQKPPGHQMLSNDDFEENCGQATCLIAFLPHILDTTAAKRNADLSTLREVHREEALQGGVALNVIWSQGGDQFEAEEKMNLQFGFPALIAVNVKKGFYAVHRGVYDKAGIKSFAKSLMTGKAAVFTFPQGLKMAKADAWDGKDGEQPKEEEL